MKTEDSDLYELAKTTRDQLMAGFIGEMERQFTKTARANHPADQAQAMVDGGKFGIHMSVLVQTFLARHVRERGGQLTDHECDLMVYSVAYGLAHVLVNLAANLKPDSAASASEGLMTWMKLIAPMCTDMIDSLKAGDAAGMRLDDLGSGKMHATPFRGDVPRATKH
jgi:hypothetical protein